MKNLLILLAVLTLSACQNNQVTQGYMEFVKEEKIEKEIFVKLEDQKLLSLLQEESSKLEKDIVTDDYIIFVRCKIDGTRCISLYFDTAKSNYHNQEIFKEHESGFKSATGELLVIRRYEDFSKILYLQSEPQRIMYYKTKSGDNVSFLRGYIDYHNEIVMKNGSKEEFRIFLNDAIYFKSS